MSKSNLSYFSACVLAGLGIALTSFSLTAATVVWNGSAGTTNWSIGGNWVGSAAPGIADDVKFYDAGSVVTASNVNSIVDVGFGGTIGSLQFAATNGTHTVLITNGATFNVTGTGGLISGTLTDNGSAQIVNATITGGGALNLNNTAANLIVDQGRAANGNATQRGILDLSGLATFTGSFNNISVGTSTFGGVNNAQNATGTLKLAQTNVITTAFLGTGISVNNQATPTNSIQIGSDNGNAGGVNFFFLGQSNIFNIDSIGVGCLKTTATMLFNVGLNNPAAYFRGAVGGNSRIRFWTIGDMASNGSSSATAQGTNDFSGGIVDAMVDTMSLGRDRQGGNTGTAATKGTLTFTAGIIDVNTLFIGNQQFTAAANVNPMNGVLNVNGAAATLRVNTVLTLGRTSVNSLAATNSFGVLNITNGTVLANNITVGAVSTNNVINLSAGVLIVSNTLTTNSIGLKTLSTANSTLGLTLNANGTLFGLVRTLSTGGTTNVIQLDAKPVIYITYPKQMALIKYTILDGAGFNFGLTNLPAWAPGAYLFNNVANSSVDLVLPFDPRPVITSNPANYSGSPGDNVSFSTSIDANSATPLTYQWHLGATPLVNGVTGSGSTISGATTATLSINNAQAGDNGSYSVTITNAYGSTNSAAAVLTISAGNVAPGLTGLNNLTVIQGNIGTFSATASGNPAPALQWQRNGVDIAGQTGNSYTVTNAQYLADDGAVFSLIATNVAGSATNSATLTVIVTPTISVQPVSLVVTSTQPATFSVTASGVPPPTYQWYLNNSPISNQTNATYTIASAVAGNIGTYKVVVNNTAGSVTSSNATLTVNSTIAPVAFAPANGASGICYDTPLAVTFSAASVLGASGLIRIYNVTNSTTPVDTINVALGAVQARSFPGDGQSFGYQTIQISGSTANIYPHFGVLSSNATYYVTIDAGAFTDVSGAYFTGIAATNVWKFSTKVGGPLDTNNLLVNGDGSGDFLTVQGAINSIPAGTSASQRVINIRDGIYNELVDIAGKHNVTFRGQSRNGTVVGNANNNNFQAASPAGASTHNRMSFKVGANDVVLDSLTISNMTPQGGSQAEALMLETSAARIIVNNCTIASFQDTILANTATTKAYFNNSLVQGDVDFIWGGGNLFFTNCEVRYLARAGNGGAVGPNPSPGASEVTSNGFAFINCVFSAPVNATNHTIGRTRGIAGANMALINCLMAPVLNGWDGSALPTSSYRNWFYGCSNSTATASVTLTNGIALATTDVNLTNASTAAIWLYGWQPSIAPTIITNPVSQMVTAGQPASFGVLATGLPSPTYQWQHAGTNLSGAIASTLNIASTTLADAGSYAVIVTTPAGSVTSTTATLTVNPPPNTAPTFTAPITGTNFTINVGVNLAVNCSATDSDSPAQALTYSLLSGPSGAAVDSGRGNFTWRPTVGQGDSTNAVVVVVTDNGTPNLSATNNFTVTVNPLITPTTGTLSYSGGQFSTSFSGQIGPDYALQSNTNLAGGTWTTVASTNSPATMPLILTDPNAGSQAVQFYRIVTGPPLP